MLFIPSNSASAFSQFCLSIYLSNCVSAEQKRLKTHYLYLSLEKKTKTKHKTKHNQIAVAAIPGCVRGQLSTTGAVQRSCLSAWHASPCLSPSRWRKSTFLPLIPGAEKSNFLSIAEKLRAALIFPNEKAEGHLKIRTAASFLCLGAVKYVFQGKHHSRA